MGDQTYSLLYNNNASEYIIDPYISNINDGINNINIETNLEKIDYIIVV